MSSSNVIWRLGTIEYLEDIVTVVEIDDILYQLSDLLSEHFSEENVDAPNMRQILAEWNIWRPRIDNIVTTKDKCSGVSPTEQRWLPPVAFPDKLICVGANYTDHLEEMAVDTTMLPSRPYAFLKPTSTGLIGDGAAIVAPSKVKWLDWEGELAVVIGKRARNISAVDAFDCVAGYMPLNDVSARDWIDEGELPLGMDWILHKSFDTFSPCGKLMTPAQFVPDPQNLDIRTFVNDVLKQESNTRRMVFKLPEIIAHLSSVMTLMPGDIVSTGSPSGVGFGRKPPETLSPGDIVTVDIERLGSVTNRVVAEGN